MTVEIVPEPEQATYYAQAILRRGWSDHMWAFDDITGDEEDWLRAWVGLIPWSEVNTLPRCGHGFIAIQCENKVCEVRDSL